MKAKDRNPHSIETPVIGITSGDAAGIGPEIIVKALSQPSISGTARFVIYSRKSVIDHAIERFSVDLQYEVIDTAQQARSSSANVLLFDPIGGSYPEIVFGKISAETSSDAMRLIETATRDAISGVIDGIVTAPINKSGIRAAGYDEKGHTGFIARLCGIDDYAMMFVGGDLIVVLLTVHVPLRDVPSMVKRDAVLRKIRLIDRSMKLWFGIDHPRIAVCGLNPHAGESGILGNEDSSDILPAVQDAVSEGIRVEGPFPADTVYSKCRQGKFDVVLAMYHDQGLIPIKVLAFGRGVNVTIGLPFIRTSPDHGTAYDIAAKGKADPGSMLEAIKLAVQLSGEKLKMGTED